jgi:hypothetical protein
MFVAVGHTDCTARHLRRKAIIQETPVQRRFALKSEWAGRCDNPSRRRRKEKRPTSIRQARSGCCNSVSADKRRALRIRAIAPWCCHPAVTPREYRMCRETVVAS